MNLIPARYSSGSVALGDHRLQTAFQMPGERDVVVGFRPSSVRIASDGIPALVELIEDLGDSAVLDLLLAGHSVRARIGDRRIVDEGQTVFVTVRPEDIHLFDAKSRNRL